MPELRCEYIIMFYHVFYLYISILALYPKCSLMVAVCWWLLPVPLWSWHPQVSSGLCHWSTKWVSFSSKLKVLSAIHEMSSTFLLWFLGFFLCLDYVVDVSSEYVLSLFVVLCFFLDSVPALRNAQLPQSPKIYYFLEILCQIYQIRKN